MFDKLCRMNENEKILSKAREFLPDCDWIGDLYELRMKWVSERILTVSGLTKEEIFSAASMDLIKSEKTTSQLKHEMVERLIGGGEGTQNYILKFPRKEVSVDYKYKVFVFEGGRYVAVEVLKLNSVDFA